VSETAESPLAEVLNRLWIKYVPQIEERAASLKAAADALMREDLTATEQKRACSEAHKLAGVLGTFGLDEGTELAREAQTLCEDARNVGSTDVAFRLAAIAEQLQVIIANRK